MGSFSSSIDTPKNNKQPKTVSLLNEADTTKDKGHGTLEERLRKKIEKILIKKGQIDKIIGDDLGSPRTLDERRTLQQSPKGLFCFNDKGEIQLNNT